MVATRLVNIFGIVLFLIILIYVGHCRNVRRFTANVVNEAFDANRVIAVVWWRSDPDDVTLILQQIQSPVVIAPILQASHKDILRTYITLRYRQLFFVAADAEEFRYYLSVVHPRVVTPIRVILLLIVSDENEMTRVMEAAWNYDVGDIIVLSTNMDNDTQLFTYFPYRNQKCGDYTPVMLDTTAGDWFPRKFNNFNGCPIRVSVTVIPYVITYDESTKSLNEQQGLLTSMLVKTLNASLKIVTLDREFNHAQVNQNGTIIGTFRDIVERKADILMPARNANSQKYTITQATQPLSIAHLYWGAPARRELYKWAKLFVPFYTNISFLIALSFILFFFTVKIIMKYSMRCSDKSKEVLFVSFAIFIGQGIDFRTSCWLVNGLFVLWLWYCLIISAAYQGELVARLQDVMFEPRLQTLEEAIFAVDGWGGLSTYRDFFKDRPLVWEKYQILNPTTEFQYFNDICRNGKRFILVMHNSLRLRLRCQRNMQILEDSFIFILNYVHLRPGWPAATEVQKVIFQFLESGILFKLKVGDYDLRIHTVPPSVAHDDLDPSLICCYGLIVVNLICVIVLCAEIVFYKYNRRRE